VQGGDVAGCASKGREPRCSSLLPSESELRSTNITSVNLPCDEVDNEMTTCEHYLPAWFGMGLGWMVEQHLPRSDVQSRRAKRTTDYRRFAVLRVLPLYWVVNWWIR
jgi:hypothetical protein